MRPQEDIEAGEREDRMLDKLAKKGASGFDFAVAVKTARQACKDAGLDAEFDERGNAEFTAFQTAKTVRYTREDASATLMLQLLLMKRLDRNRNFMWAIIALLLIIVSKLG
jgi:hypothetical protein